MIRIAEKRDLVQINVLRKQVNDIHVNGRPDIFKSGFGEKLENQLYLTFERDNTDIIVAEINGVIRGFACIEYIDKPESAYQNSRSFVEISEFSVDTYFRRQGIGTQIFEFIKSCAKSKNYSKIELNMWEFNIDALKFYEAIGFNTFRRYLEFVE